MRRMALRMLVCDVNDTLAQVGMPPTPKAVALLRKLEGKGVILVLASGRSIEYLKGFSRAIGIHPLFIADNGSMMHDLEQYTYFRMEKRLGGIGPLKRTLKKKYGRNIMFINQESSHLIEHRYSPEGAKVVAGEARKIAKELGLDVRVGISGNGAVYISSKRVHKGLAIAHLKRIYHVKTEQIAAIGNDANDKPVIKQVGLFVGVGKGREWGRMIPSFGTVEGGLGYINSLC